MRTSLTLCGWLCALMMTWSVGAQERYPVKPVRIIAPAVGVSTDVIARVFADKLSKRLGQPFIVDNRPGAAGIIAAQAALAAPADGYTVLIVNAAHIVNNFLYDNLSFESLRDFSGVALVAEAPFVLVVRPALNVNTVSEFIALAKHRPGTINYASAGFGSTTHLAGALFADRAGIELVHVPYKAMGNLVTDILGGHVQSTFVPAVFLLKQIQDGSLRALAVTSRDPMTKPLALPSISDAARLDYEFTSWNGFVVVAKTPLAIRDRLAKAIEACSMDEDVQMKFKAMGQDLRVVKTLEFDAYMKADRDRLEPLVRSGKASAEQAGEGRPANSR